MGYQFYICTAIFQDKVKLFRKIGKYIFSNAVSMVTAPS